MELTNLNNLVVGDEIFRLQKSKKKATEDVIIPIELVDQYKSENGWEIIKTYSNKKAKISRTKPHNKAFEDRVWTLFSHFEYNAMNEDSNFRVKYTDDPKVPGKQIDVFAIDNEVVLLIECKSALESNTKRDFQKDINEIIGIRPKIEKTIRSMIDGSPKICWVFATNNLIIKDNDRARLQDANIKYLNENDISYYEKLYFNLGTGAKYQIYGKFFSGQTIPELKNKIPAIRGEMGGFKYYSFSIEPETLLKISYVLHRVTTSEDTIETYQRMIKRKRIQEITRFIDGDKNQPGGFFPNAIIINLDTKKGTPLQFDLSPMTEKDAHTSLGILHLPQSYRSAYIIDGQHRLYGYANSKYKAKNTIPVIAFQDLPADIQTDLFVDINSKQKSVSQSLLQILDSELKWSAEIPEIAERALKSRLVQKFGKSQDSPLYNRIKLEEDSTSDSRYITLTYFVNYGLSKTKFFIESIQKKKVCAYGYLYNGDLAENTLEKSYQFLKRAFELIVTTLPDQWGKGNQEGGFIGKNIGITSYVVIINDILEHEKRKRFWEYYELSAQKMYDIIKPYLVNILIYLQSLSDSDLSSMSKQYGAGGVEKVRREFQRVLHEKDPLFSPEGLEQYLKEASGKFNEETREMILELQTLLNEATIKTLKSQFGEEDWWNKGVPKAIVKACVSIQIDQGREEDEWHYLMLMHYKEIAEHNWALFGPLFTPPKMDNVKRDLRLSWLNMMNTARNQVMHPERSPIKEEVYNEILQLYGWLKPRLVNATKLQNN